MLALGNIQFFLQRGLSLVGMLPALIFFVRYLREKGTSARVYYFLSLFVYIISFVLFHFSLFFALFFGCILGAFLIEKRLGGKYMWVKVLTFVPFVVFPVLLVGSGHGSTLMSDTNLPSFFATHKSELLVKMLNLYTVLMVPDQTIGYMANRFQISRELFISKISIPVILTTFGFFGLIARARPRGAGALALACLVYIPFALFIAIYLRWELVNDLAGRSRYLYIPSVVSSLFWGIFLWSVLYVKRGFRTAIALGILVVVIAFNIKTIAEVMDADQYKHEATKQSLDFIRKLAPGLQNDAIVILPNVIGYHGTDFVQLFYGKPHTYFLPKFALNVAPLPRPFDPAKDVIIDYDYEAKAVRDLTNGYKGILP
ncbi:MAG: hypothetical protein HZA36_02745 [Parcubacteria group bacterium]|nr:hypothetical protein [Parcubacteria group bacterium]